MPGSWRQMLLYLMNGLFFNAMGVSITIPTASASRHLSTTNIIVCPSTCRVAAGGICGQLKRWLAGRHDWWAHKCFKHRQVAEPFTTSKKAEKDWSREAGAYNERQGKYEVTQGKVNHFLAWLICNIRGVITLWYTIEVLRVGYQVKGALKGQAHDRVYGKPHFGSSIKRKVSIKMKWNTGFLPWRKRVQVAIYDPTCTHPSKTITGA